MNLRKSKTILVKIKLKAKFVESTKNQQISTKFKVSKYFPKFCEFDESTKICIFSRKFQTFSCKNTGIQQNETKTTTLKRVEIQQVWWKYDKNLQKMKILENLEISLEIILELIWRIWAIKNNVLWVWLIVFYKILDLFQRDVLLYEIVVRKSGWRFTAPCTWIWGIYKRKLDPQRWNVD